MLETDLLPLWRCDATLDGLVMPREDDIDEVSAIDSMILQPRISNLSEDEEISDQEENTKFEWPSDVDRFNALMISRPGSTANVVRSPPPIRVPLHVDLRAATPFAMGQHRVSSLRILSCIMRDHHRSVFDDLWEPSSLEKPDDGFWETLYIGPLDSSWGLTSVQDLKDRFEWVLDYIQTGEFPSEARTVQSVLREVLADSLLHYKSHPYSHEGGWDTSELLNPDLSSKWVESLLSFQGLSIAIQARLKSRNMKLGFKGLCYTYGILIADL